MNHEILVAAPLSRKWTDRFALEIAMSLEGSGDSIPVILDAYELDKTDLELFLADPLFDRRVQEFRTQLKEKGLSFKLKAGAQADLLLDTSWDLIHNPDVSPAVKADMIKWTAKMAGHDSVEKNSNAGNGVQINIHMGDSSLAPPPGIRTIEGN
jgi:hypothetical protein